MSLLKWLSRSMKKLIAVLLIGLIGVGVYTTTLAGTALSSTLADRRAETADGRHSTYESHGRTITVI